MYKVLIVDDEHIIVEGLSKGIDWAKYNCEVVGTAGSGEEGMELIRPLYLVREADICAWRDYNDLHFLQCACHFTDTCTTCHEDGTTSSKRLETKKLIAELKKTNPFIESNIFKSVENVNLDTVIEYKKDGVRHNFLDEY